MKKVLSLFVLSLVSMSSLWASQLISLEKEKKYQLLEQQRLEEKRNITIFVGSIINARSYDVGEWPQRVTNSFVWAVQEIKVLTGIDLSRSENYSDVFRALRQKWNIKLINLIESIEGKSSQQARNIADYFLEEGMTKPSPKQGVDY